MAELPAAGDVVGGFRIERELGRGGMGVVYLAHQLSLSRNVALKVIAPQLAVDREFERRFEREARHAAAIDHPNVVPVYETGRTNGLLYLAMRYVEGTDLSALLSRGRLAYAEAAHVVAGVGDALDAAHRQGLIHRDVKPANILLAGAGPDAQVYLSDFGLTKDASSESGGLTLTGQLVGTLDYMAPEQIDGRAIDARTDVYALGCVLFQMLTGEVPYAGSPAQKMYAHATKPPPSLSATAPELPPAFEPLVLRAMAKDPDERYPSAGDLGRAVQAVARGEQVTAPERTVATGAAASGLFAAGAAAPTQPRPVEGTRVRAAPPAPVPAGGRRRMPLWVAGALVVLAIGAVAGLVLAGGGDDPKNATKTPAGAASTPDANRRMPTPGVYTGVGNQRGPRANTNGDYPVSMTFSSSGSSVTYSSLDCKGTLVPERFDGKRWIYREQITSGRCDTGGTWGVHVVSDDTLEAGWSLPSKDYTVSTVLRLNA